ncbi:MAG: hypothetical protein IPP79_14085 [Chitinophagaceae bacterium]|nr:hypothetical protein [Chitinophagaceae bacterium]
MESKKYDSVAFRIEGSIHENKLTEQQVDQIYDDKLSKIPVAKDIEKKSTENLDANLQIDKVLKLACNILKNSEDVDDYEEKRNRIKTF